MKTEPEKLLNGKEYHFPDQSVAGIKENALKLCQECNAIDPITCQNDRHASKGCSVHPEKRLYPLEL